MRLNGSIPSKQDIRHPNCPNCGTPMWLARIESTALTTTGAHTSARVRSLRYRGREVQIASGVFRSGLLDRAIAARVSATVVRAMTTELVSLLLRTPTLFDGNIPLEMPRQQHVRISYRPKKGPTVA